MSDPVKGRAVVVGLTALVLAACFRGTLPALELYRLVMPSPADGPTEVAGRGIPVERPLLEGSLAVAPYRAPGIYGDPNIVYRVGEARYGSYPSRQWALPLALMLGQLTERVLAARPLSVAPAIYSPPSRLAHPYEWQGVVREFEEVNRGREVLVAVAFDVRLVRTADEVVVWQGSESVELPVAEPTMPAIVRALSAGAAEAVQRLIADARATLERTPPGVGR